MIHSDGLSPSSSQSKRSTNCIDSDRNCRFHSANQVAQATMGPGKSASRSELTAKSSKFKLQMFSKIGTKFLKQTTMQRANIETRTTNLEETKRKTRRTYHPIIRLLGSAKLSFQLLAILTLVPIKPIYLQSLIEPNINLIGVPHFGPDMLNNFAFLHNQNQDLTRRMLKVNSDLQHQQQQNHILPRFDSNSNPASLIAELRDEQSIYRPNVRQTLLADFVANQGHRILKNLVNNTIGDIVSQSAIRLATKSLIPQGQQFLLQQLQQQQKPLADYQMLPNENLNNRYFPSVGKLYTLLFPNTQIGSQQSSVKIHPSSPVNPTSNTSAPAEAIQSSSSNNQNMYLGSQKESNTLQRIKDNLNREKIQEKQVVNLIAPYDSRPRKSITSSNFIPSSSEPIVSQTTSLQFDTSKRPRRDKSRPNERRRLNQIPSKIPYDQAQESAGHEVVNGETGGLPAGLDPESMSQFETSDLLQSNQKMPDEHESDDRDKPEINTPKSDNLDSSVEQPDLQQAAEQPNEMQQLTSSSDFSGYFGARKNHADNQLYQNDGRDSAIEAQIDQLNQISLRNQEPAEHHTNHKNQIEGADYLLNHETQLPSQSTQDEDGNLNQGEMHLVDHHHHQQQQHVLENATNDRGDTKMSHVDTSLDGLSSSNSEAKRFKASMMNETQNDESFLTAKLPSQYDAVIRMPPEGYYDDYFKPVSSNIALQSSTQTTASLLNQDSNGISEYQTIGQTPPESARDHAEHFQIESEGLTNGQSTNSSQRNHNYHDLNQANFNPLSMDYAKQFYSNQQSVKPNEANVEHSIEIFPQTNHSTSSNKKHEIINYELPTAYENYHNDSHASNNSSEMTTGSRNNGRKYVQSFDNGYSELRNSSNNSHLTEPNEDTIQVIIANTNNSRDPVSNEKVINYTSDGQNITRSAGKPARNTFVNKEMNEFPPADEQNYPRDTLMNNMIPERNIIQQQVTGLDQQQQQDHSDDNSFKQQIQPLNFTLEQSQTQSQSKVPVSSNGGVKSQMNLQSADEESDEERVMDSRPGIDNDMNELRRLTDKAGGSRNFNNNELAQNVEESTNTATMSPKMDNMSRDYRFERNNNINLVVRDRRQKNERDNHGENRKRPRTRNEQKNSINHPRMSKNNKNHRANRLHKQQTIRRPQITQAHFDPKDLITHAPTPSPSVTESTIDTISELPAKMKRLKDNQPDKNELMNELLTALDRVKVAIYKLQPLTAKMNAIYRKSVTSNTRDIIMDNHKGTYAKRYPPGDYDDTYDRMHPSELISRDRSSNPNSRNGRTWSTNGGIEANESTSNAVYLPAPKEILESYERNYTSSIKEVPPVSKPMIEIENLGESLLPIVATGIGRRLGDGRVQGELDVNSGGMQDFDDFIEGEKLSRENVTNGASSTQATNLSSVVDSAAPVFMPVKQLLEDSQSPLFGYRITIFQSPEGEAEDEGDANKNRDRFSYSTEGLLNSLDNSSDSDSDSDSDSESVESDSSDQSLRGTTSKPSVSNDDSMATSESSVVEQQLTASPSLIENVSAENEEPDESESKKKEEKKSSHESESEKKSHKEQGKKKKEGSKKSSSKKKKQEEEKKKKKEYKKIKHDKKVVSKEKKSMKRDKHIKAHDRGAAKEKALKERTQIEFFEREQIVDDEFEKGKKSTVKAGWETGHDSKKTMKDSSSGDPMSVGGSHHIAQHVKDKHIEKGSGIKLAASSAKKSNKFEKKNMDAKGKKFKGWREKGYKIITETEFIDRGSLHDSAYKKRDKGAAHHQKYKKHQASSEGHHGSMHVHHKKSAKEEKKKSKMHEKKAMNSKKSEKEGNKHEKKSGKKKKEKSGDKQSAASSEEPVEVQNNGDEEDTLEGKESVGSLKKQASFVQPVLLQTVGSTSFLIPKSAYITNSNSALTRLLNANHHEEPVGLIKGDDYTTPNNSNSTIPNLPLQHSTISKKSPEAASSTKYNLVDISADEAGRRSDIPTARVAFVQRQNSPNFQNASSLLDKSNATILDIVDNVTGRQINKAKIGTYELEDHHNFNNRALNNSLPGGANTNSTLGGSKQIIGTKYSLRSSQTTPLNRSSSNLDNDSNNDAIYLSTTNRSQPKAIDRQQLEDDEGGHLLNLLQRAQQQQKGQENINEVVQTPISTRQPDRGPISISLNKSTTPPNRYNPPTSYLTSEQAKLAANLFHLVQQARGANKANGGPMAASNQYPSLLEANSAQNRNQFSQATNFVSPSISEAHQARPPAIFYSPAHMNRYADSTGLRTFGNEQFLDYEQDPFSRLQQTFIIG